MALNATAASEATHRFRPAGGPTPTCGTDGGFSFRHLRGWPARGTFLDGGVAMRVQALVGSKSVVDIGAGSGQYGAFFAERRALGEAAPSYTAFDGADGVEEYTSRYGKPGSLVRYANLCNASSLAHVPPSDWVMSLEVGEHLPERCLSAYIHLLHSMNREGIVLSWAHPGQGGTCHISNRAKRDVVALWTFFGYEEDREEVVRMRKMSTMPWLRENIFVLRRRPYEALARPTGPHAHGFPS